MLIREAIEIDLPALTTIYNEVITTTTAVYSDDPVTVENRRGWWAARYGEGHPVLVAAEGDEVLGFGSFHEFRSWPGYRYTVEHSLHVRSNSRGRGVGTKLLSALIQGATALGKHAMIGGIDAENTASIALHERLGFERVGHFREVGYKFGRWLDLVFVERLLGDSGLSKK